jgi:predicted protein tyrosine phosphatase
MIFMVIKRRRILRMLQKYKTYLRDKMLLKKDIPE